MLRYHHPVDQDFLSQELAFLVEGVDVYRRTIAGQPDLSLSYFSKLAILDYEQGLAAAWGLQDQANIELFKQEITMLTHTLLTRFPAAEVGTALNVSTLCLFGLGQDPHTFKQLAHTITQDTHTDPQPNNGPGTIATRNALAALTTNNDSHAQQQTERALTLINEELAPPDLDYTHTLPAIQAILNHNQQQLNQAINAANTQWAENSIPTRGYRAGPETLINHYTSTLTRIAKWRGLTTPQSPYIIEIND
jgi:hypothetical protein